MRVTSRSAMSSGIHFRTADVVGNESGTQVGDLALDNYFQPTQTP
jgi:hypothetical protein